MAQVYNCRLTRGDPSSSWGFRLQGGKDFGTPLVIQKVNVGSLAERAGLQVGDAVLRVNNKDVSNEKHKDAQDTIIRAGNSFEITVQRGGYNTWKPSVIPVGSIPSPNPYSSISPTPVTKTSLAANNDRMPSPRIPQGFNSAVKPFSPLMNGNSENGNGPVKAIVNKQYNSPVGIYSDESIAETLSAQAEVLAGGVLGVNFKKNEKDYNAEGSEVFKMVQEAEKEPKSPEPIDTNGVNSPVSGLRHVSPPKTTNSTPSSESSLTPGKNICADCERLIVGVFVRIKDKNLHVECFKCATCGTSLKNVGYYTINNKLYCDIHAKMVAKQNHSASNLEPVTVSPYQSGAMKPFKPLSPQPSSLTPAPFHPPQLSPNHVTSPSLQNHTTASVNGTKPFKPMQSNVSDFKPGFQLQHPKPFPKDTDPKSLTSANPSVSPYSSYFNPTQQRLPFLKPKAEKASAFMPVMKSTTSVRTTVYDVPVTSIATTKSVTSDVEKIVSIENTSDTRLETVFESADNREEETKAEETALSCEKRQSICSQEIIRVLSENKCSRNLTALVDQTRPESPAPSESADEFSTFEYNKQSFCEKPKAELTVARPRSVRSISPCERPSTPGQVVVFPPPIPECFIKAKTASPVPRASPLITLSSNHSKSQLLEPDTKVTESNTERDEGKRTDEPISLKNSPPLKFEPGIITSLLTTAPTRPFTPIEPPKATIFTENIPLPEETTAYLPETDAAGRQTPRAPSPFVTALQVGSERSFSPIPTSTDYHEFLDVPAQDPPSPLRPSMADALAIAPIRSYTIAETNDKKIEDTDKTVNANVPDLSEDPSLILTRPNLDPIVKKKEPPMTYSSLYSRDAFFPPINEELKAKFEKKKKTGSFSSKKSIECASRDRSPECSRMKATSVDRTPAQSPLRRPLFTDTGLHKAVNLPHYQHCVKELTAKNKRTPSSSRRSTPMLSDRANQSYTSTPTNFEATVVSTKQKIFHADVTTKIENRLTTVTSSATSFLTQTTDISEKVPPALGYQPCPMVERASFEKIEKCVQNIRDSRITKRSVSPVASKSVVLRPSSAASCQETGCKSPQRSSKSGNHDKSKHRARSRTCRTPDQNANIRPSPLALPPSSDSGAETSIIVKPSGSQCFRPPTSPTPVISNTCKASSAAAETSIINKPSGSQFFRPPASPTPIISNTCKTSSAATGTSIINKPSGSQFFRPPASPTPIISNTCKPASSTPVISNTCKTSSAAASLLSRQLSKTLSALTSANNVTNLACSNKNLSNVTSNFPNANQQAGGTVGGNQNNKYSNGRTAAGLSAPRRGKGVWNPQNLTPGARIPLCAHCNAQIRGPFVTALGKIWCPEHFVCVNNKCNRSLLDIGFVEEPTGLYCEYCFEQYLAPQCSKCNTKIKGDCLNGVGKHFHPECFTCAYCGKLFGNNPFFLEDGLPYCENDWNELFTTKCFACGFPIEAGDRWVEALNNNYHSPCFNCTICKSNLEGQSFYAKGGRPFCKNHSH